MKVHHYVYLQIKVQKEVESKLRKSLDNSEMELQKSRKHLEPFVRGSYEQFYLFLRLHVGISQ